MPPKDILIVDDEAIICESLKEMLTLEGYAVDAVTNGAAALERLKDEHYRLILSDIQMPGLNGMELLKEIKGQRADALVILITGHGHIEGAVEAIKLGAYDYITKPIDDLRLKVTISRALEQSKLRASYENLKKRLKPWDLQDTLLFRDRKMEQLLELVHTIADTQATVLITGESGTGKSLLARYIHQHSSRAQRPFVKISCGSLSETLLESELFGHVRGAFTGAIRDKKGKFEEAQGGTIFVDDINSASPNLQVKLLRVLQEKVIEKVGDHRPIPVDVRIITATNQDLQRLMAEGRFRDDLYFRINVIPVVLPPLRDRRQDIPLLVEHFLTKGLAKARKAITGVSPEAMELLLDYSWPGNVRELINVIDYAMVLCPEGLIQPRHLPAQIFGKAESNGRPRGRQGGPRPTVSREALVEALRSAHGKRAEAARLLGVSRVTLWKWLKEHQVQVETVIRD